MNKPEIIQLYDFKRVPIPDKLLEIKAPVEAVEQSMGQTAKRYLTISQTEGPVQKGDIVIADLQSADPAWQRDGEHINVGLGFAEPALEESLPGMRAGEEKTVDLRGIPVMVCVVSIRRLSVPVLTDAHVQELAITGVETLKDYREYVTSKVLERAKREKLNALIPYVIKQVAAQSEFHIPDDAIQNSYDSLMSDIRRFTGAEEDTPEANFMVDFCAQQFHKKLTTVDEARTALREFAVEQVKQSTLAQHLAKAAGKEFDQSTYEAYLQELSRTTGEPVDTIRNAASYDIYLEKAPLLYLHEFLSDYYQDKFTVLDN